LTPYTTPIGVTYTAKVYWSGDERPRVADVPKIRGRMYNAAEAPWGGTKEAFFETGWLRQERNFCEGMGGIGYECYGTLHAKGIFFWAEDGHFA
jgi:hypothetical protein